MKLNLLLIYACILFSCSEKKTQNENPAFIPNSVKIKILNKYNNTDFLYIGTPVYDSVKANYPELDHNFIDYSDKWRLSFGPNGKLLAEPNFQVGNNMEVIVDSSVFKDKRFIKNDTLIFENNDTELRIYSLNHMYPSNGRLRTFYAYIIARNDTVFLYTPQETTGDVIVQGNDTTITNDMVGNDSIYALIINLPLKKDLKGKNLFYRNKPFLIK